MYTYISLVIFIHGFNVIQFLYFYNSQQNYFQFQFFHNTEQQRTFFSTDFKLDIAVYENA
jgi:hypothetical protein